MMNEIKYEIVGTRNDGQHIFKFVDHGFDDVELCVYGIEFVEDGDQMNMKFDYDIETGAVPDDRLEEFKTLMGDFLVQSIEHGLKNNNLVYTGGTNENRTNNTEQLGV